MHLQELLRDVATRTIIGTEQVHISDIQADSRQCGPGVLFAAVWGIGADGHDFIADALQRGAAAVLCERIPASLAAPPPDVTFIVVTDSRKALAQVAHNRYGRPADAMRVIGVTGTNGKTTVAFLLHALFRAAGETVGLIGTTGNYIDTEYIPANYTTPEAPELAALLARMRAAGVTTVVMEVSSHALEMQRVHGIRYNGAIFTNLSHDHMDFHGSLENYRRAKKRLFDTLNPAAIAVLNQADAHTPAMHADTAARNIYYYGRTEGADIRILREHFDRLRTQFTLQIGGRYPAELHGLLEISMPLVGPFNIENAAAAIGAARACGLSAEHISRAMQTAPIAPGRMERYTLPNGGLAVVDFAHTPDALDKALAACRYMLQPQPGLPAGRLHCVFGCGGDRDPSKRPLMGATVARHADSLTITNDNPRTEDPQRIIEAVLAGIPAARRAAVHIQPSRAEAIREALQRAAPGDIVLIAGKGHEPYQIIGRTKLPFSDQEQVKSFIAEQSGTGG